MSLAARTPARGYPLSADALAVRTWGPRSKLVILCGGTAPTPPKRSSPREPRLGSGMSLAARTPARGYPLSADALAVRTWGPRSKLVILCGGTAPTPPKRSSPREPRLGSGMSLAARTPARGYPLSADALAVRTWRPRANSLSCGGKAPHPLSVAPKGEPRLGPSMGLAASRPARRPARQERERRPANPRAVLANHHNAAPSAPSHLQPWSVSAPRAALRLHLPDPKGRGAPWGPGGKWRRSAGRGTRPDAVGGAWGGPARVPPGGPAGSVGVGGLPPTQKTQPSAPTQHPRSPSHPSAPRPASSPAPATKASATPRGSPLGVQPASPA